MSNNENPLPPYLDPVLVELVTEALDRLRIRAVSLLPHTSRLLLQWFDEIGRGSPIAYFLHPRAFPTLLLPWWLEGSLGGEPDLNFHADLVYSSVCGYYAIRLIDDVMDEASPSARALLPTSAFLFAEFQSTHGRHFPADSPFWNVFDREWARSAEASTRDADYVDVDWPRFCEVAAQKVCAAKIPMAAVCVRRGLDGMSESWNLFFHFMSRWHQFSNDLKDWQRDRAANRWTYFLCEGRRRNFGDDSVAWVTHEGFAWGLATLREWLGKMRDLQHELGGPWLAEYLAFRDAELSEFADTVLPGLAMLARVLRNPVQGI